MRNCFQDSDEIINERSDVEEQNVGQTSMKNVCWNSNKPANYNILYWRVHQVENFYRQNPKATGMTVQEWIREHRPNPWPEADVVTLNEMLRCIRSQRETEERTLVSEFEEQKMEASRKDDKSSVSISNRTA